MAQGLRIEALGQVYELKPDEVTAEDAKDFRREVGTALGAVFGGARDVDLDVIAGVIWIVRRKEGERTLKYHDVAGKLTYASEIRFPDAEPEKDAKAQAEADLPEG